VGHTKGRTRQFCTLPIDVQRFSPRPTLRRRGWRWLDRLPIGHGALRARRQGTHALHRSLEKPALFFLGRLPGASGWRWRVS
jgi:hypothetical protein